MCGNSLRQPTRTREPKHIRLFRARREQKQENSRQRRTQRHRHLPPSHREPRLSVLAMILPRPVNNETSDDGPGDTTDGDNGVVAVGE